MYPSVLSDNRFCSEFHEARKRWVNLKVNGTLLLGGFNQQFSQSQGWQLIDLHHNVFFSAVFSVGFI